MNYIIYPKEQKTSYTRGKEITQSVLKSNAIFFILNQTLPSKQKCTFLIPVITIKSHQLPVTIDPELTALKGNRPGIKVSDLLRKNGQICTC